MRAIAALSQHPVAAEATAEVVGQVLEDGPDRRDLAVLVCSAHHVDAFAAVASAVHKLLSPGRLVGVTAGGVVAGDREVEDGPAISLWVGDLGTVPTAVRLTAASTPTGTAIQGLPRVTAPRPADGAGPAGPDPQDPDAGTDLPPQTGLEAATEPGSTFGSDPASAPRSAPEAEPGSAFGSDPGTESGARSESDPESRVESEAEGEHDPGAADDAGPRTSGFGDPDRTMMLIADPFSLPVADVLDVLAAGADADAAPVRVIGGVASAALVPGGNRLALDDRVYVDGGVGVLLGPDPRVETVVSQGCRPVGSPMIVTRSEGNQVIELAGRTALERLEQLAGTLGPEERALLEQGVHLGVVADEHQEAFGRGDFLVRSIVGADRRRGALSVGASVEVGTTVQFHVRDAASADEDLRALLATRRRAEGALVFTCNGRGRRLFGEPDHDARLVAEVTTGGAVAGMFCAGEVGPVGRRSFLHGFTACVLLLG